MKIHMFLEVMEYVCKHTNQEMLIKQTACNDWFLIFARNDTILMAESEEELKSLLRKVKEASEKVALQLTFRKRRSWHLVPSLHGKSMGKQWKQCQTSFFWAPKSLQMVTVAMKLKGAYSLEGKL